MIGSLQPAEPVHGPAPLEDLLGRPPYGLTDEEKARLLLPLVKGQLAHAIASNRHIRNFFERQGIDVASISRLEDVPPLPVQMFKLFDLATRPREQIVRVLKSSGTTSGLPSRVPLDKAAASNQVRALKALLADYLGERRRVLLVIDHKGINDPTKEITARTAGVRGLSIYAKKVIYLLKEEDGKLTLDRDALRQLEGLAGEDVYAFGFTYIIWSVFYPLIARESVSFRFRDFRLFHGGGWKKLQDQRVSKEEFSAKIAGAFGTDPSHILDFYGMAEQTGIIFVDCEQGHKHVPAFAQVIPRDLQTLKPCGIGEPGLIEVMSVLADSYYCQAVLTEDIGYLAGVDDCPCGRKGRYFRFLGRVEQAEVRGCGDTFRER